MNTKPSMKFRVVQGRNPRTGGTIQRPQIVERETYYLDQVVEYALNAGYVRGQFHDMRGALNGFIEAIQQLGKDGKAVNLNNWLRVHAELTGQVGESRQLSDANELHVVITALQDLKSDWTKFSWTNVEDSGVIPKVEMILSPGGKPWEAVKTKGILVTGRNLFFDAAKGDTATISWGEGASAQSITVTPTESDYSHMLFAWPTALAEVEAGTKLTISFRTCAGIEWIRANVRIDIVVELFTQAFHAVPSISRCLSVRCSPASRLMVYFLLLTMSAFRVMGCVETSIIHDFLDAVGVFLLRRRPPPRGWCSSLFFFNDPHGLPLFFADPVDITISVFIFF